MIDAHVRSLFALASALVFVVAADVRAQEEQVVVGVDGPCVDVDALRFAVGVRSAEHPDARVAIRVRCGEPVHADVEVRRGDAVHTRAIEVSTAEIGSLVDAIALIVAVGLEEEVREPEEEPSPPPSNAPPEADAPPAIATVVAGPSTGPQDRWGAAIGLVALGGLLPDAAVGLALSGEWRSGAGVGVELEASAFAPSGIEQFEGRVSFWSIAGRASLCALFSAHEQVALGGCAGVLAGAMSAEASGFRGESLARWEAWFAIEGRVRVELTFGALIVRVDAIVAGAPLGPSFYVERLDAERAVAHEISPVLGGAAFALGVRFGP